MMIPITRTALVSITTWEHAPDELPEDQYIPHAIAHADPLADIGCFGTCCVSLELLDIQETHAPKKPRWRYRGKSLDTYTETAPSSRLYREDDCTDPACTNCTYTRHQLEEKDGPLTGQPSYWNNP